MTDVGKTYIGETSLSFWNILRHSIYPPSASEHFTRRWVVLLTPFAAYGVLIWLRNDIDPERFLAVIFPMLVAAVIDIECRYVVSLYALGTIVIYLFLGISVIGVPAAFLGGFIFALLPAVFVLALMILKRILGSTGDFFDVLAGGDYYYLFAVGAILGAPSFLYFATILSVGGLLVLGVSWFSDNEIGWQSGMPYIPAISFALIVTLLIS